MTDELPPNIGKILEYLAEKAKAYRNSLQWDEQEKLKADLINSARHWAGVDPDVARRRCVALGMTSRDAATVRDLLERAGAGRALVPHSIYGTFAFRQHDAPPE